jgi:S1-C subfamily serine protease
VKAALSTMLVLSLTLVASVVAAGQRSAYECAANAEPHAVAAVGITLCTAQPTPVNGNIVEGALVTALEKGSVAAREGLNTGDLIYRISGTVVKTAESALALLEGVHAEGDTVVNFARGGSGYLVHLRLE